MVSCPRTHCLTSGYRIFFPMFYSKRLIVLCFTFRLVLHLIFYKVWVREKEILRLWVGWGKVVCFVLLAYTCPNFPIPFVEKTIFPLSKINWAHLWGSFSGLSSGPLIYVSIPLPVPHCLDYYCSCIVSRRRVSWILQLYPFKIVLAILVLFPFHVNSGISLSISTKSPAEIFIGIALNL